MIELLRKTENYQTLVARLRAGNQKLPWLRGLANASTAYLLATLIDDFPNKSFLIVLPSQREAEQVLEEICTYTVSAASEATRIFRSDTYARCAVQNESVSRLAPKSF